MLSAVCFSLLIRTEMIKHFLKLRLSYQPRRLLWNHVTVRLLEAVEVFLVERKQLPNYWKM